MTTSSIASPTGSPNAPRPRVRGRLRWLLLAAPLLLLGGGLLARAQAHGHGLWGELTPEERHAVIMRRIDRALGEVQATPDQITRIKATFDRLGPQMEAIHAEKAKLHQAVHAALGADLIDPAAIERFRQDGLRLFDRGSALLTNAIVEAAQVLTPEQRRQLLARGRACHGGY